VLISRTVAHKKFFNELAEVFLYFIYSEATTFHNIVLKIEGDNLSITEVSSAFI
jgi:hypothetical protein